ncbi:Gfo/Idh/MocA family oxidoreductase [Fluoribacter dumoffii]|uniref:Gfo/Idh/MocA family protein n=1 Tax=Fluoribacter dumoffii TaxID=463 RepID=UPI002243006A|nr:Gfo/Idh/MocA family oxidoreductase [Fluoribacter dumoffii]MCW8387231.1 Gfo/Idh/MocA family oxidoreductase [Fluoribacter dumoffii]MCW8497435.1 Gfo/Idh/MocA family oxidoreductase [Fluoribacter dumoffii]
MKKIVVIGLGSIGKRHINNLRKILPNAQIWGVSSSGSLPDGRVANADRLSVCLQEAIEFKPDFAVVASPATYHFPHAKMLLAANIPVLIEKPITADIHETEELIALVQQANLPVSVAYCLRYLPAARMVKTVLEQKKLGTIYNVYAHVGQYLPQWRNDKHYRSSVSASKKLGGGALLELSHELDYLHWFLGELNYQYGMLRNTQELDLEVEEIADIVLTANSGALCSVHMDFLQKNAQRHCHFVGEKGSLYWDVLKNNILLFQDNREEIIFNEPSWDKNNMYLLMLQDFIERIEKGDGKNDLRSAQRTIELIDEIKSKATWGTRQ